MSKEPERAVAVVTLDDAVAYIKKAQKNKPAIIGLLARITTQGPREKPQSILELQLTVDPVALDKHTASIYAGQMGLSIKKKDEIENETKAQGPAG